MDNAVTPQPPAQALNRQLKIQRPAQEGADPGEGAQKPVEIMEGQVMGSQAGRALAMGKAAQEGARERALKVNMEICLGEMPELAGPPHARRGYLPSACARHHDPTMQAARTASRPGPPRRRYTCKSSWAPDE